MTEYDHAIHVLLIIFASIYSIHIAIARARILTIFYAHILDVIFQYISRAYRYHTPSIFLAGVPTLKQVQNHTGIVKRCQVRKAVPTLMNKDANNMHMFLTVAKTFTMPKTIALLNAAPSSQLVNCALPGALWIPILPGPYGVHGACFTGAVQIKWIGQLVERAHQWVAHGDGTYKYHYDGWIILSLGTHQLKWDAQHNTLSNSFVPLIYMFCKEHESNAVCTLLCDAGNKTAEQYYGAKLEPGGCIADHSDGLRNAFEATWPEAGFAQCWPHIVRKFGEGEYVSKKWAHLDETLEMLRCINLARTDSMKVLLLSDCGNQWDAWGNEMDKFWDSNCQPPWDCWSVSDSSCMLMTASNQTQESWHREMLRSKIPGMFKGSTERVLSIALPQLVRLDGYLIADELCMS